MKKSIESFSSRLTRNVVFTVLVIMAAISVLVFFVATAGLQLFSKAHYSDIMDKAKGDMAQIMGMVEVSANNIMDELSWHLATPELVLSTLQYELNVNRHLNGCAVGFVPDFYPQEGRWYEPYALNAGDAVTMKIIGSQKHDYFQAEWYRKGLVTTEGVWSNPYLDQEGGETVLCTFSRPLVMEPDGEIAGVFGADISLDGLSARILDLIGRENEQTPFHQLGLKDPKDPRHQIYCFIIGPDGDYIVHPDKSRILKTNFYDYAVGKKAAKYRKLGDTMRAGESGEMRVRIDGIESEAYFAQLLHSGWSMCIVVPIRRLLRPGYLFGAAILILIFLGLLTVSYVCHRSIKKTSRPLIQLSESAREIAMGKFDTELPRIDTHDEILLLRDSFDNMQTSLAEYIEELKETTAQNASIESELGVARNIQMSMLPMTWPAFPDRDDLDIYGCVSPAKAVGGDLYDFRLRDGKLFFCIGDVSGKGIPAALVMTVIGSMFQTISASVDSPERMMNTINSALSARNESLMFATLFAGVLDLSTGVLHYTNAGHNAPFVLSGGNPRMLEVDANVPVGIMQDWVYSQQETTLPAGSVLFLYTDGLTEAARSDGQLFQEDRVMAQLSGLDDSTPVRQIISAMTEAVSSFVGDAEQSDDLTMLAFRISAPGRCPRA
jgi:sigma-B regulation protein RsbU (phosphoserine phosphatase)